MKKERNFQDKNQQSDERIDEDVIAQEVMEDSDLEENTELSLLQEENQKLKDEFLRVLADAENTKKRCAAEIEKNNKYALTSFAKDLLGVADNLQRALQSVGENASAECDGILKGVELTQAELKHIFEKFGIRQMEIMGTVFDPNFHQVIQQVEDKSKPAGTILAELQTGYMINDRLLREAMVVVAKGGKS